MYNNFFFFYKLMSLRFYKSVPSSSCSSYFYFSYLLKNYFFFLPFNFDNSKSNASYSAFFISFSLSAYLFASQNISSASFSGAPIVFLGTGVTNFPSGVYFGSFLKAGWSNIYTPLFALYNDFELCNKFKFFKFS